MILILQWVGEKVNAPEDEQPVNVRGGIQSKAAWPFTILQRCSLYLNKVVLPRRSKFLCWGGLEQGFSGVKRDYKITWQSC